MKEFFTVMFIILSSSTAVFQSEAPPSYDAMFSNSKKTLPSFERDSNPINTNNNINNNKTNINMKQFINNLINSINNTLNKQDIGIMKYNTYLKDVNLVFCIDNSESMKNRMSSDEDTTNLLTNQQENTRIFLTMLFVLINSEIEKITVEFINPVLLGEQMIDELKVDIKKEEDMRNLYDCLIQEPYGERRIVSKMHNLFIKYSESTLHTHIITLTNGYLDSPVKSITKYKENIKGLRRLFKDQFETPRMRNWWNPKNCIFNIFDIKDAIPTKGSFTVNLMASTRSTDEIKNHLSLLMNRLSEDVCVITNFNNIYPIFKMDSSKNTNQIRKVFEGYVDFIIYKALVGSLDPNEYTIENVKNEKDGFPIKIY